MKNGGDARDAPPDVALEVVAGLAQRGLHGLAAVVARDVGVEVLIDAMLGDPEDVAILAACDIDTMYTAALRRHATVLRAVETESASPVDSGPRPRVLKLIGMAYRALRTDSFLALSRVATR